MCDLWPSSDPALTLEVGAQRPANLLEAALLLDECIEIRRTALDTEHPALLEAAATREKLD